MGSGPLEDRPLREDAIMATDNGERELRKPTQAEARLIEARAEELRAHPEKLFNGLDFGVEFAGVSTTAGGETRCLVLRFTVNRGGEDRPQTLRIYRDMIAFLLWARQEKGFSLDAFIETYGALAEAQNEVLGLTKKVTKAKRIRHVSESAI